MRVRQKWGRKVNEANHAAARRVVNEIVTWKMQHGQLLSPHFLDDCVRILDRALLASGMQLPELVKISIVKQAIDEACARKA